MSHIFTLSHVCFRPNRARQHIVHCLGWLGEAGEAVGLDGKHGSKTKYLSTRYAVGGGLLLVCA